MLNAGRDRTAVATVLSGIEVPSRLNKRAAPRTMGILCDGYPLSSGLDTYRTYSDGFPALRMFFHSIGSTRNALPFGWIDTHFVSVVVVSRLLASAKHRQNSRYICKVSHTFSNLCQIPTPIEQFETKCSCCYIQFEGRIVCKDRVLGLRRWQTTPWLWLSLRGGGGGGHNLIFGGVWIFLK